MTNKILLTNIQRFSLHDGPGIRTTVFLKGCSVRCPWCCNPENLKSIPEKYLRDGVEEIWGKYYDTESLFNEIMKDVFYYDGKLGQKEFNVENISQLEELPGGVTFSGGEALLQMSSLKPLIEKLQKVKVHVTVETSLFVQPEQVDMAISLIDLFYVDIKILDVKKAMDIYQGDISLYLNNVEKIMKSGKPVIVRVPVIGGYTDFEDNIKDIADFILKYSKIGTILKVELIKGHNLGSRKYNFLQKKIPQYIEVDYGIMEYFKDLIENRTGKKTEICSI